MSDDLQDIILRLPPAPQGLDHVQALLVTMMLFAVLLAGYQLYWRGASWWRHWRVRRLGVELGAGDIEPRLAAHRLATILRAGIAGRCLDAQQPPRVCSEEQRRRWSGLLQALDRARFHGSAPARTDVASLLNAAPWWLYRD